jgi:hypothetical protein
MRARLLLRPFAAMALGLWALLASTSPASAQPAPSARESAVKAAFLYKFAAFVEWPPGTFERADQPLVIGVSGDDDIADDLEQLVADRSDKRPVSVRRVHDEASISGVHVLFVARRREARLRETLNAVKGPVLLVTEQPGALRLGSVLNFSEEGGRVRFGASLTSAEARNLKLSARLLAVAQVIEGRNR